MSEREKEIMTTIANGLSQMSEFEKGYVLGIVETRVNKKEEQERQQEVKELVC